MVKGNDGVRLVYIWNSRMKESVAVIHGSEDPIASCCNKKIPCYYWLYFAGMGILPQLAEFQLFYHDFGHSSDRDYGHRSN